LAIRGCGLASWRESSFSGSDVPRRAIEAADLVVDNMLATETKEIQRRRSGEERERWWRVEQQPELSGDVEAKAPREIRTAAYSRLLWLVGGPPHQNHSHSSTS
jgi:hypothetical protein